MSMITNDQDFSVQSSLADISRKVKAMGYLLSRQISGCVPLDIEDINEGLGQIIMDLGNDLYEISVHVDESSIESAAQK